MKVLCILFLAIAALTCNEARATGGMSIGVGSDSCATFIRAIDAMSNDGSTNRAMHAWEGKQWVELGYSHEQWILGYISASSHALGNQIVYDRDGIVLAIKKICEQHPDELLITGVSRFVYQYTERQKGGKPDSP